MLVAQISDFHVAGPAQLVYGRIDTNAMLRRAVAALNSLDPQPDLVIGSGDLVQSGADAEYDVLIEILRALKAPFAPVMGNHDRRAGLRRAFPAFEASLGPAHFIQYSLEFDSLRVIVLDTVTQGSDAPSFCEARAQWLDEALAASRTPALVVTHHPPFATGVPWMDPPSQDWAAPLERSLQTHGGAIGLISGHIHRAIHTRFAGLTASSCPSTAHLVALDFNSRQPKLSQEAPGFQLHRFDGGDLRTYTASLERFGADFSPDTPSATPLHD
jgi:Icc protein